MCCCKYNTLALAKFLTIKLEGNYSVNNYIELARNVC